MNRLIYTFSIKLDYLWFQMNLRQLEVFEALMNTGSIAEAARFLGVSQQAVTKSLRLAEQSAGLVFFRRAHGRVYPSPEAEMLLPQVGQVRTDLDAVGQLIRQMREGNAGQVAVAAPASVAHSFITPALIQFARESPGIRVEVMILPTNMVADRVASSQADFGIVHQPTDNPYLDGEVICEAEGICVMPVRHPLAQRRSLSVRDLQGERLICYREDTAIGWLVRKALAAAGVRREIDIVINQSEQALDLVEGGTGIGIMDPFMLIAKPRAGLAAVPFRPAFPNRLRVIRARERPRSRAAAGVERAIRAAVLQRIKVSRHAGLVRRVKSSDSRVAREGIAGRADLAGMP